MDIDKPTVADIFGLDVQYRVPLFQRHYAWSKDRQWVPLWKDISVQTKSESSLPKTRHFTGSIVIQQKQSSSFMLYDIIDGQQRLVTFAIILCALRDMCRRNGHNDIGTDVGRYLANQGTAAVDGLRYKIVPSERDKSSFFGLIADDVVNSRGRVAEAYQYFSKEIYDFVGKDRESITTLFNTIIHNFSFVRILIDETDKPEKIFESLNARGKPLFQFDLLRNNLFLRASADNRDKLYEKYWRDFESDYWDPDIERVGVSCETFLQHFLMAKLGQENVKPEFHVYDNDYQTQCYEKNKTITDELGSLKTYSDAYCQMTDCDEDILIGRRMKFYKTFNLTTMHAFLLFIICEVRPGTDQLEHIFDILESYVLRRMLCFKGRGGLKGLNIYFTQLIKNLQSDFSIEKFLKELQKPKTESRYYPSDNDIKQALLTRFEPNAFNFGDKETIIFPHNQFVKASLSGLWVQSGGTLKKRLIKYVLYRIEQERWKDSDIVNIPPFTNRLSLEHVMPKKWHKHWDLPINPKAVIHCSDTYKVAVNRDVISERKHYHELFDTHSDSLSRDQLAKPTYDNAYNLAIMRDALLDSIGNLTLVLPKLNAELSNASFTKKKERLEKSDLRLNREIKNYTHWDVNEIDKRSQELIQSVCEIWKPLDKF